MTDPRRQRFAGYIRDLADRLRLRDWTVDLADAAPRDPDGIASVRLVYGRKLATVYLSDGFLTDGPADQRHTLVHELIHAHLEPAHGIASEGLAECEYRHYRRLMEYGVDGLADAVAPLMPLPTFEA